MLSRKTTYGLRAVLFLARNYQRGPVLIVEIARQEQMPQKFLEAILLELRKGGILESKKGKGGGYILAKPPSQLALGDVIAILESPILLLPDPESPGRTRPSAYEQAARGALEEAEKQVAAILQKTSLADVLERAQSRQKIHNFDI